MVRKAEQTDITAIADTYTELLVDEQRKGCYSTNWKLGVYPTIAVPRNAVSRGTMYVLEENGEICASMVLNHEQAKEYAGVGWQYPGEGEEVMVIHTLCVPPQKAGRGYGRKMVEYAKKLAGTMDCSVIRLDTFAFNEPAKKFYLRNGFRIAGYGRILLQGLIEEEQVYLEYGVRPAEA